MCDEFEKLYKISSIRKLDLKKRVNIWQLNSNLCCFIAVYDGTLLVMFYNDLLNYDRTFLFSLKKIQNSMLSPNFFYYN